MDQVRNINNVVVNSRKIRTLEIFNKEKNVKNGKMFANCLQNPKKSCKQI